MSRSLKSSSEALAQQIAALPPFEIVSLSWALLHTFSIDAHLRAQAELFLKTYEADPKFSVLLIELLRREDASLTPEQSFQLKQSGSIFFKQCIIRRWITSGKEVLPLPDDVKAFVRDQLPDLLVTSHKSVTRLLTVALKYIIQNDFPSRWPELVPKAVSFITSATSYESPSLIPALMIIRIIAKNFDLKSPQEGGREPLEQLIQHIFPILQKLLESLIQNSSVTVSLLESYLCKIFYSCVQFRVPQYLKDNQNLVAWMNSIVQIILKPLPEGLPQDRTELAQVPHWKSKIRAARALNYFFYRHGNPSLCKEAADKEWANGFLSVYAEKVIQMFLSVLQPLSQGVVMPDKFVESGITLLNSCVKIGKTYIMIRDTIPQILTHILFPLICFRQSDIECWNSDPEEYLRKEFDILEDYCNPKVSATKLLVDIAQHRNRVNLNNFMQFLLQVLQRYQGNRQCPKLACEKDGALLVIGKLAGKLMSSKQYRSVIEGMIVTHILPDVSSPFGFLRARACWAFVQFHDIAWSNPASFIAGVEQVVSLVRDSEKIVKIQAAVHIRDMFDNEQVLEKIKPILPHLLEAYMNMMTETENDELVTSLELLINAFADDIEPYAVALCTKLSEAFIRLWKEAESDDRPVGDMEFDDFEALSSSGMAALECLRSIQTVLKSVRNLTNLYLQIEKVLLPLLHLTLNGDCIEFIEELFHILSFLTYYGPSPISADLWTLFPLLHKSFNDVGVDFIDSLLAPLDNFISRGKEQFLAPGTPYLEMVFDMYNKLVGDNDAAVKETGEACKLIEVVLLYLRRHERVDAILPQILKVVVNRIPTADDEDLLLSLYTVIADAMYYDPIGSLRVLEEMGATGKIFTQWFEVLQDASLGEHAMKIAILGLSSIFEIPIQQMPQSIQLGVAHILSSILRLSKNLQEYREERDQVHRELDEEEAEAEAKEKAKAEEESAINGDDSDNDDIVDDETDVPDVDAEFDQFEDLDDLEGEDLELESLYADADDEDEVITAIEDVDEAAFFTQIVQGAGQREPDVFQKLFSSLNQDDVAIYNTLVELAKINAAKAQQQQQQQQ